MGLVVKTRSSPGLAVWKVDPFERRQGAVVVHLKE